MCSWYSFCIKVFGNFGCFAWIVVYCCLRFSFTGGAVGKQHADQISFDHQSIPTKPGPLLGKDGSHET